MDHNEKQFIQNNVKETIAFLKEVNPMWYLIPLGLFVAASLIEYICDVSGFKYGPTYLLKQGTLYGRRFFTYLGELTAVVSSFLIRLKLERLVMAFVNTFVAAVNFCFTPFYWCYGYVRKSLTYYTESNPILVYIGSALIVTCITGGTLYYFWNEISLRLLTELFNTYPRVFIVSGAFVISCPVIYFFISETSFGKDQKMQLTNQVNGGQGNQGGQSNTSNTTSTRTRSNNRSNTNSTSD